MDVIVIALLGFAHIFQQWRDVMDARNRTQQWVSKSMIGIVVLLLTVAMACAPSRRGQFEQERRGGTAQPSVKNDRADSSGGTEMTEEMEREMEQEARLRNGVEMTKKIYGDIEPQQNRDGVVECQHDEFEAATVCQVSGLTIIDDNGPSEHVFDHIADKKEWVDGFQHGDREDAKIVLSGSVADDSAPTDNTLVSLNVVTQSFDGWQYLQCQSLNLLADETPIKPRDVRHDGKTIEGDSVLEALGGSLSVAEVEAIANAEHGHGNFWITHQF